MLEAHSGWLLEQTLEFEIETTELALLALQHIEALDRA